MEETLDRRVQYVYRDRPWEHVDTQTAASRKGTWASRDGIYLEFDFCNGQTESYHWFYENDRIVMVNKGQSRTQASDMQLVTGMALPVAAKGYCSP